MKSCTSSIGVLSPLTTATGTQASGKQCPGQFADPPHSLKARLWFRRDCLPIAFSLLPAQCCCRVENPLIPAVQTSSSTSQPASRTAGSRTSPPPDQPRLAQGTPAEQHLPGAPRAARPPLHPKAPAACARGSRPGRRTGCRFSFTISLRGFHMISARYLRKWRGFLLCDFNFIMDFNRF